MKTLQIDITLLKLIIEEAETMQKHDNSLSNVIEFELRSNTDLHLENDGFSARLKSSYAECVGKAIILK